LAAHPETSSDGALGVPLRDRPTTQTTPRERPCCPPVGRRERRSTNVLSWSSLCLAPEPVPSCHRHAAYSRPSHNVAGVHPSGPARHGFHPPTLPGSIFPVRLPVVYRSRIAGTEEDGPHTSRSGHAPADPVLPTRAQSADLGLELARSVRNAGSSTWAAHDESPENTPARTPISRKHLRPACATLPRSRDKRNVLAHASGFALVDDRASSGGQVGQGASRELRQPVSLTNWAFPSRRDSIPALPAVAPVARSAAPVSPTFVQTACGAA